MRTTVLAYVIAATGLVMALGGMWALFVLSSSRKPFGIPWRYYAVAIGMIAGGVSMLGLAQICGCWPRFSELPEQLLVRLAQELIKYEHR